MEEWTVKRFRAWSAWQIITDLVWEFRETTVCVSVCVCARMCLPGTVWKIIIRSRQGCEREGEGWRRVQS